MAALLPNLGIPKIRSLWESRSGRADGSLVENQMPRLSAFNVANACLTENDLGQVISAPALLPLNDVAVRYRVAADEPHKWPLLLASGDCITDVERLAAICNPMRQRLSDRYGKLLDLLAIGRPLTLHVWADAEAAPAAMKMTEGSITNSATKMADPTKLPLNRTLTRRAVFPLQPGHSQNSIGFWECLG